MLYPSAQEGEPEQKANEGLEQAIPTSKSERISIVIEYDNIVYRT